MIIFDTSPLIHLTKIGKIRYAIQYFGKITIPKKVKEEAIDKGVKSGYLDAILLKNLVAEQKIEVLTKKTADAELENYLDQGEYEAIMVAKERGGLLIIDERRGRKIAQQLELTHNTTLGLMYFLLREQCYTYGHYQQNLDEYSKNGWIKPTVVEEFLKEGKEYE